MSVSVSKPAEDQVLNLLRLMADPEAAQNALKEFAEARATAEEAKSRVASDLQKLAAKRKELADLELQLEAKSVELDKRAASLRDTADKLEADRAELAKRVKEHEAAVVAVKAEQDARSEAIDKMAEDLARKINAAQKELLIVEKKLANASQEEARAAALVAAAETKLARIQKVADAVLTAAEVAAA